MTGQPGLDQAARRELLGIARACLDAAVTGRRNAPAASVNPQLQALLGCFVTYKHRGRLRGCIGCFDSARPLWQTVAEYATHSAVADPRFADCRITPGDLPEIDIEISVLSPRQRIANPLDLELGVHGIHVERDGRSGCFLPQVATEHGMTKEQFLSECCAGKAGLPPDAWRDPRTRVWVFTAEIISEKA
jgi:AmmeMemoRadiSam system protein A